MAPIIFYDLTKKDPVRAWVHNALKSKSFAPVNCSELMPWYSSVGPQLPRFGLQDQVSRVSRC